jgi:DNA (cytosine-5)-methyltransferase 1
MNHPQAFLQDERANLFVNFLEYVEWFRPLAVLMENVQDMMNYGGKNVAEEIALSLRELGYITSYTIVNSVFYGVPQMRQRLFLMAMLAELGTPPQFPGPTHFHEVPSGYDGAYQVALKTLDLLSYQGANFVAPARPEHSMPPAVTARDALADLPPIVSHLQGKAARGVRSFNQLAKYRSDVVPSPYASEMRTWPGLESSDGVCDHVTRFLPRDFRIFARMKPGDQYPEAHQLALDLFESARSELAQSRGKHVPRGSPAYRILKSAYVPPYDPAKFPNKWRKMEADQPARTLTAHIGKDTYSHIHYDSSQARVISVREAARLQSFPDGFEFTGPMNAAFRQIGNAVPPLLAFHMAAAIKRLIQFAK